MGEIIVVSGDGLRRLASDTREAQWRLSSIHSDIARQLATVDRNGWSSHEMDGAWGDANSRLGQAQQRLDGSQSDLDRRARLADDLNRRAPSHVCTAVDNVLLGLLQGNGDFGVSFVLGSNESFRADSGSSRPDIWEIIDWTMAYLLIGKSSKLGQILRLVPDLRYNPLWTLNKYFNTGKPGGFLVSTVLKIMANPDDQNPRGVAVAAGATAIEWAVSLHPVGRAALGINMILQLGGAIEIWSSTALAKLVVTDPLRQQRLDDSAEAAQRALRKLDIGKIIHDLSALVVDYNLAAFEARLRAMQEAWEHPSILNIMRLALYLDPNQGMVAASLLDSKARQVNLDNVGRLAHDVGDFVYGIVEYPIRRQLHLSTVQQVVVEEYWERYGDYITRTANDALERIVQSIVLPLPVFPVPVRLTL